MRLSMYISDANIKYVVGDKTKNNTVVIKEYGNVDLEKGIISSGNIADTEALQTSISYVINNLKNKVNKYELVIDSSTAMTKIVEVPELSPKKLHDITISELMEFAKDDVEYVYDYAVLDKDEKNHSRILCAGIERHIIESYTKIFANCGIKLSCIDITRSTQIRMISHMDSLSNRTFVLCVLSGNNIHTSLFVKGTFLYASNSRINTRGNLGVLVDINKVISSFIQFNKSQKNDADVETIYFSGMTSEEKGYCNNITTALGIEAKILPACSAVDNQVDAGYNISDYFYTTGNLFRK